MQIGYLMPGFRVSFRVWGVFGFRSFRFLFSLVRFLPLAFRFFWVAFAVVA